MMYQNMLRDFFMRRNPWQMPAEPPQMISPDWMQPMPFEGGVPTPGNGWMPPMPFEGGPGFGNYKGVPNRGMNVPNMGTNALAQMGPFGGGMRRPGMMGIRQRY